MVFGYRDDHSRQYVANTDKWSQEIQNSVVKLWKDRELDEFIEKIYGHSKSGLAFVGFVNIEVCQYRSVN